MALSLSGSDTGKKSVTDIIRDIDEEMRRDAFLSRVRRYAWVFLLVVVVVLFIVAAISIWVAWLQWATGALSRRTAPA